MSFYSFQFPLFLLGVYVLFRLAPERVRWAVLLVASFLFYSFFRIIYLPIALAYSILVTYLAATWIDRTPAPRTKQTAFLVGLLANLALLVLLRYLPFVTTNFNRATGWIPGFPTVPVAPVLVSIGVSYFVFQAISYLIDVYSVAERAEPHLGILALYLAFFPKLLQGPIERAEDLIPQLKVRFEFQYENFRAGLVRFGIGLFKKLVLADRIGIFVDAAYGDVHSYTGVALLFATYLYAFQLYFDFSAYTDMAIGVARVFNIQLSENFRRPYQATSIAEFWRRWHITFSRWLLDYLFTPLQMGFRNWKKFGTPLALLLTFIVSGIWHGASWGFITWGVLHGFYLSSAVLLKPYQRAWHKRLCLEDTRILRTWQVFVTFHLVCFAWIFFRANSLSDAQYLIAHFFVGLPDSLSELTRAGAWKQVLLFGQSPREFAVLLLVSVALFAGSIICKRRFETLEIFLEKERTPLRWAFYFALILTVIVFPVDAHKKFIYFQF